MGDYLIRYRDILLTSLQYFYTKTITIIVTLFDVLTPKINLKMVFRFLKLKNQLTGHDFIYMKEYYCPHSYISILKQIL